MCHIINTTTGKSIIQCQYDHKDQASAGYVSNPSSVTDCHIQKCSNDPKDSTGRSSRYSHTSGLYIPPCRPCFNMNSPSSVIPRKDRTRNTMTFTAASNIVHGALIVFLFIYTLHYLSLCSSSVSFSIT